MMGTLKREHNDVIQVEHSHGGVWPHLWCVCPARSVSYMSVEVNGLRFINCLQCVVPCTQ